MKQLTKEEAKLYLDYFSIFPIKHEDKSPNVYHWTPYRTKKIDIATLEKRHTGRIALVCGFEGLEVIDIDLKHIVNQDGTPNVEEQRQYWQTFLSLLENEIEDFKDKFAIYSTVNKGYHIIYKYEVEDETKRAGSLELAYRIIKAKDKNGNLKDIKKALIETRGAGGYAFCYPNGKEAKLSYFEVKTVSKEDRDKAINIARSLNEVEAAPVYKPKPRPKAPIDNSGDVKPGDAYNERHDVWEVIKDDFKIVEVKTNYTTILRINDHTTSKDSGKIFKDTGKLYLHTPNTIYPPKQDLTAYQAYTYKHHGGDFAAAARELARQGYGHQKSNYTPRTSLIDTYTIEDYPHEAQTMNKEIVGEEAKLIPGPTIPTPQDNKELTIVNSATEAAQAKENNIANVIHLEAKELNQAAINDALDKGYNEFNLYLDNDKLSNTIDELLKAQVKLIYVANELTAQAIEEAPSYYVYKLNEILYKYDELVKTRDDGILTFKEIDKLKHEIVTTAATISDAIDSKQFTNIFLNSPYTKAIGIDAHALNETIKEIQKEREQRQAIADFKKIAQDIATATDKGDLNKAFELHKEAALIEVRSKASGLSSLLSNNSMDDIREALQNKPSNLFTGYTIEDTPLNLPASALTIIAGSTGHGKTTYMTNLAVNLVKLYDDKQVYFFSYEEDTPALVRNAINVYTATELSRNNRRTIDSYLKDNTTEFADADKREIFRTKALQYEKEVHNNNRLIIKKVDDFKAEHLCTAIRHLRESSPSVAAVFVDYIQLIYLESNKDAYSRQDELKRITDQLKSVANETGLVIVLGAQFNRNVNNILKLEATNIREAADIEHSAALVLGVWNNSKNYGYKNVGKEEAKALKHLIEARLAPTEEESLAYCKGDPSTMYTKILKNRTGIDGLEEAFYWNGNTSLIRNKDKASAPSDYNEIMTTNPDEIKTPF